MTAPDFSVYQPPGVYVAESPTPTIGTLGLTTTIIGLIGPSVGFRTNTEAVTLNGVTNARLSKLGIDTSSIVVRGSDGTVFTPSDWTATAGAGVDANISATTDNTTDIKRSALTNIDDGATVVVQYKYTDALYYTPQLVNDYETVKDLFGEPFDANGNITSPISLGAKFAFDNGAQRIWLVAVPTPVTREGLSTAYTKIQAHQEINLVVPMPVGLVGDDNSPGDVDTIAGDLANELDGLAGVDRLFRVALLSYDTGVKHDPKVTAAAAASRRVVVCWPYRFTYFNGLNNQNIEVGGFYAAAGYAGKLAALRYQDPLTRKPLRGFANIPSDVLAAMTESNKSAMGAAGVAVTERTRDERIVMRHGVTTDPTNVYTRELNLVRARDALLDQFARSFDQQGIIGAPIDPETPSKLKAMALGILDSATSSGLIFSYTTPAVRQSPDDNTIMEIKFQYKPTYPLNYVLITFSIDTSSGVTTVTA